MGKSNEAESEILLLQFNAVPIPGIADNAATPSTVLWASLYTGDPGEAGNQSTNELDYDGYARVAVARSPTGFTVVGSSVTLAAPVDFPEMTGGPGGIATHFAIGMDEEGGGTIRYSGTNEPEHLIQVGNIPRLKMGTTITED
jgi:hypothetical protein